VIEDVCTGDKTDLKFDVKVPDATCEDVYGVGPVVFGATWSFKNWTAAIQDCRDKGLEIALPTNRDENAELLRNLQKSFETHPNARKFAHENWVRVSLLVYCKKSIWVKFTYLIRYQDYCYHA
jgi:hypothetical protein